jgi:hypothetical protein
VQERGHPVDLAPNSVRLDSITYAEGEFLVKWTQSPISDFEKYVIEQISLPDSTIVDSTLITTQSDTSGTVNVAQDKEIYFRLRVTDKWNQSAWSSVRGGSSYQRVVKVDYIREIGDDITILNMGSGLPFTHLLSNVNAQFTCGYKTEKKYVSLV